MKIPLDVLIFDIDGVLIDVSESYRTAIRETVQLYLQDVLGLAPLAGELVSSGDVAAFKLAGGFNNDWDLTIGLLKYFVSQLDTESFGAGPGDTHASLLDVLHESGARTRTSVAELLERKDISTFTRAVAREGGGLPAVWKILGARNDHLLVASGSGIDTNLVKRIFEEMYLGEEYFSKEYGRSPLVYHGPGLIRRERRIIGLSTLDALRTRAALGIATGRPRDQARFALETAGIAGYFQSLVAHEDIVQVEERLGGAIRLGKPHPFGLLEAVRRITSEQARCAYIGDTLDDVRAANAAKDEMDFRSIACLAPAEDKDRMRLEFERVGADMIVNHPDDLVERIE